MNNEVIKRVEELNLSLVELQKSSKRALGFTQTLEYKETFFHVSRLFVIADLSPLAYMDMSQEIVDGVIQTAVIALFERLRPLLECRHRWTPLMPDTNGQILQLERGLLLNGTRIHTCTLCTAYGLGSLDTSLPIIGRNRNTAVEVYT